MTIATDFLGNPVTLDEPGAAAAIDAFVGGFIACESSAAEVLSASAAPPPASWAGPTRTCSAYGSSWRARGASAGADELRPGGRSRRLTLNYHTSRQNLPSPLGVIGGDTVVGVAGTVSLG